MPTSGGPARNNQQNFALGKLSFQFCVWDTLCFVLKVCFCFCICMWWVGVYMCVHTCGGMHMYDDANPHQLFLILSHHSASYSYLNPEPTSAGQSTALLRHPHPCLLCAGITGKLPCQPGVSTGSGDPNTGPHTCTESSPQPWSKVLGSNKMY